MRCEDYPCCGHTDGLGCDWTSPNDDPDMYWCSEDHGDDEGTWHVRGQGCWARYDDEEEEEEEYATSEW